MTHTDIPAEMNVASAREAARNSLAFGVILTVLGIFAVLSPLFT